MLLKRTAACLKRVVCKGTRYAFNCIQFERSQGLTYAVATDTRAVVVLAWEDNTPQVTDKLLVQASDFAEAAKVAKPKPRTVRTNPNTNYLEVVASLDDAVTAKVSDGASDPQTVTLQRNDGRFPGWQDIMPKGRGDRVEVDIDSLINALQTLKQYSGLSSVVVESSIHTESVGVGTVFEVPRVNLYATSKAGKAFATVSGMNFDKERKHSQVVEAWRP